MERNHQVHAIDTLQRLQKLFAIPEVASHRRASRTGISLPGGTRNARTQCKPGCLQALNNRRADITVATRYQYGPHY